MANVAGYDQVRNMTFLDVTFITKSSVKQRRGRAGRTQAGVCFHLYTKEKFHELEETQVPEIKRSNLAKVVLKIAELQDSDTAPDAPRSCHNFEFVEAPSTEALDETVINLLDLEAIEYLNDVRDKYKLTENGKNIIDLDITPELYRMIQFGSNFGVQSDVIAISSIQAAGSYIFYRSGSEENKRNAGSIYILLCLI